MAIWNIVTPTYNCQTQKYRYLPRSRRYVCFVTEKDGAIVVRLDIKKSDVFQVQASMPRVTNKQDLLMSTLTIFYQNPENLKKMLDVVTSRVTSHDVISLRLIDWFVTNYAKAHGTMYGIDYRINGENKTRQFMVHTNYKAQLKAFFKKNIPFARGTNIEFVYAEGKSLMTTVGQLNLFRWAVCNHVLDFISEHFEEIEADMTKATKDLLNPGQRKQLSIAATRTVTKHEVKMTVEFN